MENRMNKLNESELEQVTGGKSYAEWDAYFDSIRHVPTGERRQLLNKALSEIKNDPDLSAFDKQRLEHIADSMWGMMNSGWSL